MLNHYYNLSVKTGPTPPVGNDPFATVVAATSPSAWWRLGEASGNAADSSGNGRTATASGSITYSVSGATTDGDTAMTFAANSLLEAADHAVFDIGTNDFSLMFALKGFTWGGTAKQIMGHDGAGNLGEIDVYMPTTAGLLRLGLRDATSGFTEYTFTPTTALDDGGWHLCFITVDRDSATGGLFYADGALEDTENVSGTSAYSLTNTRTFRIAAANSSGNTQFVGSLDEIAIWNGTILSPTTIADITEAL